MSMGDLSSGSLCLNLSWCGVIRGWGLTCFRECIPASEGLYNMSRVLNDTVGVNRCFVCMHRTICARSQPSDFAKCISKIIAHIA